MTDRDSSENITALSDHNLTKAKDRKVMACFIAAIVCAIGGMLDAGFGAGFGIGSLIFASWPD